ncbi:IclR family transcriptional regulator [Microbacterium soli]|uniref:IclR family transcriptional regulator n=1 Tax=Microbacterium soli TaxID=446075 RepID=A0ABP7MT64_9MICO
MISPDADEQDASAAATPGPRSRRVRSVDHAIDVMQVIAAAPRGLGLADIAGRSGMSKAAVYHLLATLETRRFVTRDPVTGAYRLDWGLYELGSSVANSVEVTRVARHYLDGLASETSEFVLLGILDEDSVLYLDRGEAPSPFRVTANTGRRFPLHATASGKVLLAFGADPVFYDRVLHERLPALTSATITDPELLRHELDRSRRRGFATCWQEGEVGLCSVAMPVHDYRGRAVAALTIVGMSTRLNQQTVQQHLPPLTAAVHAIEERLGYQPTARRDWESRRGGAHRSI